MPVHNSLGDSSTDLYETPVDAVAMLLSVWKPPQPVWEPACGRGAIVGAMNGRGVACRGTSLEHGQNFLRYLPDFPFASIVTNPPFSIKNQFIKRCLWHKVPFALLMPVAAIETAARQRMFSRVKLTMVVPDYRIEFVRFDGKPLQSKSNMASAWFICEPGPHTASILFVQRKWIL